MPLIIFCMEVDCSDFNRGVPQVCLDETDIVAGISLVGCCGMFLAAITTFALTAAE